MKQLKFQAISIFASLAIFFFGSSAHALTIDTSALDTLHTESHGPFGVLHWAGVSLKITKQPSGSTSGELVAEPDMMVEGGAWLSLEKPETKSIERIVTDKDGTVRFEHADLLVDSLLPALQITSLASVKLTEVARLDPKVERGKALPIYAYRVDAAHVVVVVGAAGSSVGHLGPEVEGSCAQNGNAHPCTFDTPTWNDGLVSLSLGDKAQVAQARGEIHFDNAPKGETNSPLTFIVNASFTQSSRDPSPILSINFRTMPTIFRGDMDGE